MTVWRYLLIGFVALAGFSQDESGSAIPQMFENPMSNRQVNYRIQAKLDESKSVIRATQWVEWRNMTPHETKTLRFHLFQNAFKNNDSAYFQMVNPYFRNVFEDDVKAWGFIEVQKLAYTIREIDFQQNFADLNSQPDNNSFQDALNDFQLGGDPDYPKDESTATLFFKKPVRRGESVWIRMEFTVKLPEPAIARSGKQGDYYLVSQWFPKVGFFEDGKWLCHPYNPYGEFYANFGVYDVMLDVPRSFEVGATGIPTHDTIIEARRILKFLAEDVVDFAWTASPKFLKFEDRAANTDIVLLLQPEHEHLRQRHLDATKASLDFFSETLGPFPYPRITVVDPPKDAFDTSGMEYPMFVTAGTYTTVPGDRFIETVIAHEIAHNYFQSVLASNEFRDPWMDEGFAEYLDSRFLEHFVKPQDAYFSFLGWHLTSQQITRIGYLRRPDRPAANLAANQFKTYGDYGFAAYTKPAMLLHTLDRVLGRQTMDRLLKTYVERYSFRHPQPKDFYQVLEEIAGAEHVKWFRQGIETSDWLNYKVISANSSKIGPSVGFTQKGAVKTYIEQGNLKKSESEERARYDVQVYVQRQGNLKAPSMVRLSYEDGETEDFALPAALSFHHIRLERSAKLISAQVDPENQWLIDRNWLDNSKVVNTNIRPKQSLLESWLHALQSAMIFAGP